ncbi:MAG: pantetheine-phosphate adenylyltransferase [Tannerellaceae bacterium]|nr:pantetheine-phosphate adenylyltransferase [Porphyromonadaceae bacterium]
MKRALFPGTFDPFTKGHDSIVKRSLNLVDELIIAIGINDMKRTLFTLEERLQTIRDLYADDPRVKVAAYDNLTVDFAKEQDAAFIIRGVRSVFDFEYEKNIADINRKISDVDTMILFTDVEYAHISSSVVRELYRFGKDVSEFLPKKNQ